MDNNVVSVKLFNAIFQSDDEEFHVCPHDIHIHEQVNGEYVIDYDDKTTFVSFFRNILVNNGILQPHEDLGQPIIHRASNTVEYFKVPYLEKNN